MKTERVTLLTTKEFKSFLSDEARREGVSVAELVRVRCEQKPTPDEAVLAALSAELRESLARARSTLKEGIKEAQSVLTELRSSRNRGKPADPERTTKTRKARK
jgi:hypothetical protein